MPMLTPPQPIDAKLSPRVSIEELPATASIQDIICILDRDGGLILTDFVSAEQLIQIDEDVAPHLQAKTGVADGFSIVPKETIIINGLVGKSSTAAAICEYPHLRELRKRILTDAGEIGQEEASFPYHVDPLLSLSLSFRIGYGAPRQRLHRDDSIHLIDHNLPYKLERVSQFACLVAACPTKRENGATMVVAGSHRWDNKRVPKVEEVTYAEMKPGSALVFLAGTYHGGGHNSVPGFTRVVHGFFFCRGTLRTEENQFLAVRRSTVLNMSAEMQSLLGYKQPEFITLGVVEGDDPMRILEASRPVAASA